ncbi:MAG: hypothetical protein ACM3YF_07580 [Candidatus Zixiibacteriota bacterium]
MNPKSGKAGSAVSPAEPEEPKEADSAEPGQASSGASGSGGSGGGGGGKTAEAEKPYKKDEEKSSWIEIELMDEDDQPVAGEKYKITLPDGSVAEGTLDQKGFVRIEGIDPGSCKVAFPNLDKDAWGKSGGSEYGKGSASEGKSYGKSGDGYGKGGTHPPSSPSESGYGKDSGKTGGYEKGSGGGGYEKSSGGGSGGGQGGGSDYSKG